jgi:hypothetical protein
MTLCIRLGRGLFVIERRGTNISFFHYYVDWLFLDKLGHGSTPKKLPNCMNAPFFAFVPTNNVAHRAEPAGRNNRPSVPLSAMDRPTLLEYLGAAERRLIESE